MDVSDRLKLLRNNHNLSQAKFAIMIDVSPGNVAAWELKTSLPGAKALISIAQKFELSIDWLLLGHEATENEKPLPHELMKRLTDLTDSEIVSLEEYLDFLLFKRIKSDGTHLMDSQNSYKETDNANEPAQIFYLPLVGHSAAGNPIVMNESVEGYLPVDKRIAGDQSFLIRVEGDSMIGAGIEDGDIVVIRPQPVVESGQPVLIRINDETMIKYFSPQSDKILLKSANPIYKPIEIKASMNFSIIGRVIKVIKKTEADGTLRLYQGS